MRKQLVPGTTISLSRDGAQRDFTLDSVLGDGASCIVYEAHTADTDRESLRCRIKECYPYSADIIRDDVTLVWHDNEEKERAFQRMRKAHNVLIHLKNGASTGNSITGAELYEGNGTLYSVMEVNHAETYDNCHNESLHSILETARVLSEIVGNLHKQGYLHLDIKPENFLVNHRPNTSIWLFDVDSLTTISEIESGEVQSTSYSRRWAAPEQLLGKTKKLCPATDIYAIGAVLFERIMKRSVSNDDTGMFADWSFDNELFDNVNPKVKRYIKEIFRKTLAASANRRYQSADELEAILQKACDVTAEGRPYICSNCPAASKNFTGRKSEITAIRKAFSDRNEIVILNGIGGIGKSEIAKAFAHDFEEEFDSVSFLRYSSGKTIREILRSINIANCDAIGEEKDAVLDYYFDDMDNESYEDFLNLDLTYIEPVDDIEIDFKHNYVGFNEYAWDYFTDDECLNYIQSHFDSLESFEQYVFDKHRDERAFRSRFRWRFSHDLLAYKVQSKAGFLIHIFGKLSQAPILADIEYIVNALSRLIHGDFWGLCNIGVHIGSILLRIENSEECLQKQCWHLIKIQEHEIWKERERKKELRKQRKAALDNWYESILTSGNRLIS